MKFGLFKFILGLFLCLALPNPSFSQDASAPTKLTVATRVLPPFVVQADDQLTMSRVGRAARHN